MNFSLWCANNLGFCSDSHIFSSYHAGSQINLLGSVEAILVISQWVIWYKKTCIAQGKISCKFLHILCTERALKMSPFLQETCKNCARNFTFLAQFLASSKNLVRNLQGARILHVKCPFSCSVSRILQTGGQVTKSKKILRLI